MDRELASAALADRDPGELTADELDRLADALFWLDRPDESVSVRRRAYRAHDDTGDAERAALAAWRLFYDHHLVGEASAAGGWLERCRRQVAGDTRCRHGGWLAVAEADVALGAGNPGSALDHAREARGVGTRLGEADLWAMAMQAEGRATIALGETARGLAVLDEAMVAVIGGELAALYTGWVYCNAVSACYGLADLGRATEWSEAAMRWCRSLEDGRMFRGLCRVYAVELACLRGAWDAAAADADRACGELTAHDPRYAGEAYYLVGELRRLRGDEGGAQVAYEEANRLGRPPQPGLALLRLAQGRAGDAVRGLRSAPRPDPAAPLPHARLLAARVEAETAAGDRAGAQAALVELHELADRTQSTVVTSIADGARGVTALSAGDPAAALAHLRRGWRALHDLGLAHDAARLRVDVGRAADALGDADTARLEWQAARSTFERLDAAPDLDRVRRLLAGAEDPTDRTAADRPVGGVTRRGPLPLTDREIEVLRLVAGGSTNRDVAGALHLSPHTVSRHLSNIFAKIGVTSRAAATAWAYEHGVAGT